MKPAGRTAFLALLGLAWLVLFLLASPTLPGLLAGAVAAAIGVTAAVAWPALADATARVVRHLDRRLGGTSAHRPPTDQADEEPDLAAQVVGDVLRTLAEEVGGRRLVVWRLDRPGDRITPEHALGAVPKSQTAGGNPVAWAVEERHAMRIEPAPSWADGAVVVAPMGQRRALTVETPPGDGPEPARLQPGARILGSLLRLVDRELDTRAERERLRRVTAFLQGLSTHRDPDGVPARLGQAAMDLLGARGVVVASWDGDEGKIVARVGADGPPTGTRFHRQSGDLAHAGVAGATVSRDPGDVGKRPALAVAGESWDRVMPYRVVVPLVDPGGETGGLVGAWSDEPPSQDGVRLLVALGPLLSLHMRQATDLARFHDRATNDALTGLPNRAAFDDRMDEEQARFHRYRRPVALMVIDLDHFKRVNDTHGHPAGDTVLEGVAAVIRAAIRDVDMPARYGGEEIVVLMPETMLRAAAEVAERVRVGIAEAEIRHEGTKIPITASIGVSGCPDSVPEPSDLFEAADQALYAAKEDGRNRVVVAGSG